MQGKVAVCWREQEDNYDRKKGNITLEILNCMNYDDNKNKQEMLRVLITAVVSNSLIPKCTHTVQTSHPRMFDWHVRQRSDETL